MLELARRRAEHFRCRPIRHVETLGYRIEAHDRFKAGVVERLARRPQTRLRRDPGPAPEPLVSACAARSRQASMAPRPASTATPDQDGARDGPPDHAVSTA